MMFLLTIVLCGVALGAFIPQQILYSGAGTSVCTNDVPPETLGNDTVGTQKFADPRDKWDKFDYDRSSGQWSGYLDPPFEGAPHRQLFFW